jgi:DNA modification methylase
MKTELTPIAKIKTNPDNPRVIKDDKFDKLVKSIQEFPEMLDLRPIVVNSDMMVLGGNMRLRACQKAGLKEVPVLKADDLTPEQQKRFIITDNASFGAWDYDVLANEWEVADLEAWGVDVPDWEGESVEVKEDDYQMPDEIKTDIVIGDLFEIGQHRLLCGDSTDSDSVAKLMGGEKADMLTDPPYGIDINMNMGRRKGQPEKFEKKAWDKAIPDFFYLTAMFENMIIWGGNYFADNLPVSKNWLCWYKKTTGLDFGEFELAWTNCDINTRLLSHHWSGETKLHPTMKPVAVMAWCLEYLTGKVIFDPFLGSGSTMVAAHQLNRKCYGMELDPKYCQVIIDRMRKLEPNIEIKKNGIELPKTD